MKTVTPAAEAPTASVLAARVARDLAVLVRVEVEAAAWSHAEQLRRLAKEIRRFLAAAASLLIALAFVSWAAVRALDMTARPWLAALLVGVAWLAFAEVLSVRGRRDLRAWRNAHPHADHLRARIEAEADARTSLEALFDLLAGELARHEEQRLAHAAGDELKTVERTLKAEATVLETDGHEIEVRAATALQELVEIVTLPGRARDRRVPPSPSLTPPSCVLSAFGAKPLSLVSRERASASGALEEDAGDEQRAEVEERECAYEQDADHRTNRSPTSRPSSTSNITPR